MYAGLNGTWGSSKASLRALRSFCGCSLPINGWQEDCNYQPASKKCRVFSLGLHLQQLLAFFWSTDIFCWILTLLGGPLPLLIIFTNRTYHSNHSKHHSVPFYLLEIRICLIQSTLVFIESTSVNLLSPHHAWTSWSGLTWCAKANDAGLDAHTSSKGCHRLIHQPHWISTKSARSTARMLVTPFSILRISQLSDIVVFLFSFSQRC